MTAVQQYWHLRRSPYWISRLYPLPAGDDGYAPGAVELIASRVLSYRDPAPEGFAVGALELVAARMAESPRIPLATQAAEAFSSGVYLVSSAVQQYQRFTLAARPPESYTVGPLTLMSSDFIQFTRVPLNNQAPEAFDSIVTLIVSESVQDAWLLRTQEAEGYALGAVVLVSAEFTTPPAPILGPNDFNLARPVPTNNNFDLVER